MKKSGDRVIARDRVIGTKTLPRRHGDTENRGVACDFVAALRFGAKRENGQITGPPDHQINRGPRIARFSRAGVVTRSSRRLARFWEVFTAALCEIFDESAYDRFLLRTHAARSVASYRDFLREREGAAPKPKCC
jgi:hypothetical protein